MPDAVPIPPVTKKPPVEMVEGKELRVDKPGLAPKPTKSVVKFRPMKADKRGRPRKLKNDYRFVQFRLMTPKQQFIKTPWAASHGDLINNDHFRAAVNFAKLQMLDELPKTYDPAKGWDAHMKMQGVLDFLEIFSRLHIEEKEPKKLDMPSLNNERFKQQKMP